MKKFLVSPFKNARRFVLVALSALFAVTALLAAPPTKVSAAGCHYFDYHATLTSGTYVYTDQYVVPSNSTCNDINIYGQLDYGGYITCSNVRVRFYPSGGGSSANSWKWHCGSTYLVVASNVLNGTHYRLEFERESAVLGVMFD